MKLDKILKITELIFLSLFTSFLIFMLVQDYFRVVLLFRKYYIEFLFLLITGYFLTSFSYDLLGIKITFNAFIIYVSNNIMKNYTMKGIELIYLFILIYFITQNILIYFVFNKFSKNKTFDFFTKIFSNVFMWCILITAYNFLLQLFNIKITSLRIIDIFFAFLIIVFHNGIKTIFVLFDLLQNRKYYLFFYHSLPYIIVDSLFIYFSIILGSVYQTIGILNTAFFIIFLAIAMSLTKFVTRIEVDNTIFFSIHSFLTIDDTDNGILFDRFPLNNKSNILENVTYKNETHFTFVVIDCKNDTILNQIKKKKISKYRFFLIKNKYLYTIRPSSTCDINEIRSILFEIFQTDIAVSYCKIAINNLYSVNLNYIFRILLNKLKVMKDSSEIQIDEKQILS
ncbi:MAG: hypothetical protein A2015_09345 [Spirochaetes bacterium GWF1_31_7]|nr:MAG: hypothetical protein A2Y30_08875 [Spirochaetes bacterium GWE1_32_154]OHD45695.1 MAG: hypothetical protein A2Y29_10260 [Spirochaetes bacterium GWE2_31_10]OHD47689.1 MAG: hypothetical protein A2015_09345 [Spirochaetes bacterium GWF1_31_7]HBD94794.1 hypothetical protein [Spirochaetia bacterium]